MIFPPKRQGAKTRTLKILYKKKVTFERKCAENYTEVRMKKRFLGCALLVLASCALFAQSITLIMVQADSSCQEVRETTRLLETCIMNSFFDTGFIITNEPPIVALAGNESLTQSLALAGGGNVSFIVPVTVHYDPAASVLNESFGNAVRRVDWELLSAVDYKALGAGQLVPDTKPGSTKRETETQVKRFSALLAKEIGQSVKGL